MLQEKLILLLLWRQAVWPTPLVRRLLPLHICASRYAYVLGKRSASEGGRTCVTTASPGMLYALGELVQERLRHIQNPSDCRAARKVVMTLTAPNHGFGSYLHFIAHGLMLAYATQRTFVLNRTKTAYGKGVWERFMLPLSETCHDVSGQSIVSRGAYTDEHKSAQVIILDWPGRSTLPEFTPPTMPMDILEALNGVHCDPIAWWIGQIMKFAFRLQPSILSDIANRSSAMGFETPIAGVHIRRRDKLNHDAMKHEVEEYMYHVDGYFNSIESRVPVSQRRIYLATDEIEVIGEIKKRFPQYKILCDSDITKVAGMRRSAQSLRGIIIDLYFLSRTNFLVCTFSSNIGRAAYEIMQSWHVNATENVRSLDCHHSFSTTHQIPRVAMREHTPGRDEEISFKKGDLIESFGDLYNGYSVGRNLNVPDIHLGIYPSTKVKKVVVGAKMVQI